VVTGRVERVHTSLQSEKTGKYNVSNNRLKREYHKETSQVSRAGKSSITHNGDQTKSDFEVCALILV